MNAKIEKIEDTATGVMVTFALNSEGIKALDRIKYVNNTAIVQFLVNMTREKSE